MVSAIFSIRLTELRAGVLLTFHADLANPADGSCYAYSEDSLASCSLRSGWGYSVTDSHYPVAVSTFLRNHLCRYRHDLAHIPTRSSRPRRVSRRAYPKRHVGLHTGDYGYDRWHIEHFVLARCWLMETWLSLLIRMIGGAIVELVLVGIATLGRYAWNSIRDSTQ